MGLDPRTVQPVASSYTTPVVFHIYCQYENTVKHNLFYDKSGVFDRIFI